MSLLSSFIINSIISTLEKQFISHVPELQQAFLSEIATELNLIVKAVSEWVESKLPNQGAPNDEKK